MEAIRDGQLEVDSTVYQATPELLELLRGLLAKKPQHRLRTKDLRRSAWLTEGHSNPLPVPEHLMTGHETVQKGELREILERAVTQMRVSDSLGAASRSFKDTGRHFLEQTKPAAPAPAAAPPPRRHPGMLKRAA
mmetsp:Transcript_10374/g.20968  ORF Transcript_10374/g.20968 Transcript_10374/m.20968 type:complete len:135 (+) Transcript_10374:1-405(+)